MIATDPETITKIQGVRFSLEPYSFHLSYSVKNSLPLDRFVRPQLECLIIHLQFSRLCSFFFLLVSLIRRQGLAFVAKSIMQCMVDNQRRSGAAIAGLESC